MEDGGVGGLKLKKNTIIYSVKYSLKGHGGQGVRAEIFIISDPSQPHFIDDPICCSIDDPHILIGDPKIFIDDPLGSPMNILGSSMRIMGSPMQIWGSSIKNISHPLSIPPAPSPQPPSAPSLLPIIDWHKTVYLVYKSKKL